MTHSIQLDFFHPEEYDFQLEEIKQINLKLDKLRKGLFKRQGELVKVDTSLENRQEKIEFKIFAIETILKEKFGIELQCDGTLKI